MKKLIPFLFVLALLFTQACKGPEGEQGPPGPAGPAGTPGATGPQGPAGTSAKATTYDISGWTFTAEDDWQLGLSFAAQEMTVGAHDAVLVYRFYNAYEDDQGEVVPVWEPLPATYFRQGGIFQYGFLNTTREIVLFITGQLDLSTLEADYTTDQIFRIVVIPADPANGRIIKPNIDYKNYNEVAKYYNIQEKDIRRVKL